MGQAARINNPSSGSLTTALDYLTGIPQLTPTTTGQSMACWVRFSSVYTSGTQQYFLVWGASYFYIDGLGIWKTNIINNVGQFPSIDAGYGPTPGQWYHVASVFNGRLNLYINGTLVTAGTAISTLPTPIPRILIGHAEPPSDIRVADISIDDVRLFTTALTAAQVLQIYQIPYFMNAPANSLLNLLGFVNQQPVSASTPAQNLYVFPFDDYLNVWIENIGPSSQEPQQITYKIPIKPGTTYWTNNDVNDQIVINQNYNFPMSRINISVLDRFGNPLNNNGRDWSFSIKVPDIINLDTAATNAKKIDGNPFQVSIPLPVFYNNVNKVELVSAEIPAGFYNIRSPFNTFVVNAQSYTISPGNYTISSLLITMNSLISSTLLAFNIINNRITLSQPPILNQLSVAPVGAFSLRAVNGTTAKAVNVVPAGIFPPSLMTGSLDTNLSTQTLGSGGLFAGSYTASCSTYAFSKGAPGPFAGTFSGSYYWQVNDYPGGGVAAPLANPTATQTTTTSAGPTYYGDWVQLQMPFPVIISGYSVRTVGDAFLTFISLGSTTGNQGTWTLIDSTNSQNVTGLNIAAYTHFRFVILTSLQTYPGLSDVRLTGSVPSLAQDFYADQAGNLLTGPGSGTPLATWLGSATGYVATWYNQLNSLNNVSQPTALYRPTISGGAITFTGTQWFSNTATTGGLLANGQQQYSYAALFNSSMAGISTICETNARDYTVSAAGRMILKSGYVGFNGESNDQHVMTPFTIGVQKSVVMMIDNTQVNNITTVSAGVTVNKPTGNPAGLNLNNYWFGIGRKMSSGDEYFSGTMKSVMVFNTALSAVDATILDTWQGTL